MSQLFLLFAATAPLAVAAIFFTRAAVLEARKTQSLLPSGQRFESRGVPTRPQGNNQRQ